MRFQEPKRARRIRDRLRVLARVERQLRHHWTARFLDAPAEPWADALGRPRGADRWAQVFAQRAYAARRRQRNRAACSCAGCGNPRRWFGEETRQEIAFAARAAQEERDAT